MLNGGGCNHRTETETPLIDPCHLLAPPLTPCVYLLPSIVWLLSHLKKKKERGANHFDPLDLP